MFSEPGGNIHVVLLNETDGFGILLEKGPAGRAILQVFLEFTTRPGCEAVVYIVDEKPVHILAMRCFPKFSNDCVQNVHTYTGVRQVMK